MERFKVGDITITRVEEWSGDLFPPENLYPDFEQAAFQKIASKLVPDHFHPETGLLPACLQSYLVRDGDLTILVDTNIGNDKARPHLPVFDRMKSAYLQNLAAAGVSPEDIDIVVCTHLHMDHVGWNTRWIENKWIPTFPNARYLFPKVDLDFWSPANDEKYPNRVGNWFNAGAFADSVQPLIDADQADIIDVPHQLTPHLILEPAPGHTPGMMMLKIDSRGQRAVLAADALHHPIQIYFPQWSSAFCEDKAQAAQTRLDILNYCADTDALLIPAHFAGAHAVRVCRAGRQFAISD